jgi:LemA protein
MAKMIIGTDLTEGEPSKSPQAPKSLRKDTLTCSQAFADIDVQLRQRHDLIPNLVETVKGYAGHERATLDAVVQARNAAVSAQGPAAKAQAETVLGGALRQLFALAEAYPNLKANSNFQRLQTDLTASNRCSQSP